MPHPVNETIGHCPCPICKAGADVRQQKNHPNGKRYLYCPKCHVVRPSGQAFQDYIAQHMHTDAEPEPQPAEVPQAAPVAATRATAPEPEAQPAEAPKAAPVAETRETAPQPKRGFFDGILDF